MNWKKTILFKTHDGGIRFYVEANEVTDIGMLWDRFRPLPPTPRLHLHAHPCTHRFIHLLSHLPIAILAHPHTHTLIVSFSLPPTHILTSFIHLLTESLTHPHAHIYSQAHPSIYSVTYPIYRFTHSYIPFTHFKKKKISSHSLTNLLPVIQKITYIFIPLPFMHSLFLSLTPLIQHSLIHSFTHFHSPRPCQIQLNASPTVPT